MKLVKRLAKQAGKEATLPRVDWELQLCSHGHLKNSKEEFEPEGMLLSFAPQLLNLLSKELIGNRCTYLPVFLEACWFFSQGCSASPCMFPVSILCGIKRIWNCIIPCLTHVPPLICISTLAIMEAVFCQDPLSKERFLDLLGNRKEKEFGNS